MSKIKVFVDDLTGDITIDVDGVKGVSCLELTKEIEELLVGPNGTRTLKKEFEDRERTQVSEDLRQRRG